MKKPLLYTSLLALLSGCFFITESLQAMDRDPVEEITHIRVLPLPMESIRAFLGDEQAQLYAGQVGPVQGEAEANRNDNAQRNGIRFKALLNLPCENFIEINSNEGEIFALQHPINFRTRVASYFSEYPQFNEARDLNVSQMGNGFIKGKIRYSLPDGAVKDFYIEGTLFHSGERPENNVMSAAPLAAEINESTLNLRFFYPAEAVVKRFYAIGELP
ncbi:MAG: lipoprotein [Proteobacteria bacterium]|nr:lipoprotein [Pseudomonadota bacterium]